jgi:hypothetical protein
MPTTLFDSFDTWESENFASGVLLLACRASTTFESALLNLIERKLPQSRRRVLVKLRSGPRRVVREAWFDGSHGERHATGRFDLLFTDEERAIAIENKLDAALTRSQVEKYRRELQRYPGGAVLCTITRDRHGQAGIDVQLEWSDVARIMRETRWSAAEARSLVDGITSYTEAVSMTFTGLRRDLGEYDKDEQRKLLIEALLGRVADKPKPVRSGRIADKKDPCLYQSAEFTDLCGVKGRWLGIYDYKRQARTALELYRDNEHPKPLLSISWPELLKRFPAGRDVGAQLDMLAREIKCLLSRASRRRSRS